MSFTTQQIAFLECDCLHTNLLPEPENSKKCVPGNLLAALSFTSHDFLHDAPQWALLHTPQKSNIDQKLPYLKGVTFSKPSFWVSMLVFGGVILRGPC